MAEQIRNYALSLAIWLCLSLLVGWQTYYITSTEHLPVVLSTTLLVCAVRYLAVAILTPPIFYLVARWPFSSGAVLQRTFGYALGYLVFVAAFATIRWCLLPPWSQETFSWQARTPATLFSLAYSSFADLLLLFLVVTALAHAYAYFVRGQRQEMERVELRHALALSELQALRVQLHPHFLFNTLQGVSTLIDTDPGSAQLVVRSLGGLLRTVLRHDSTDLITLREELELGASYLELQEIRLKERLQVRWRIEPGAHEALIPQLLLQPLIENAVIHGSASAREGGWVEVGASVRDGRLHVLIRNSLRGRSEPGVGVGIRNTRARLRYLYAGDATFELQVRPEEGLAAASLVVPAFTNAASEECAPALAG